jgi:predicted nucleic acid-binding protein
VIVLDTTVIVYALIEGAHTALARKVMRLDREWRVPGLWAHEFLNVLVTYVRHDGMHPDHAVSLWRRANLLLAESTRPPNPLVALHIAIEHKIAAYDAEYLALARELGVCCVTADRELFRKVPSLAKSMEEFCASL